jgi:RING-box protein 1
MAAAGGGGSELVSDDPIMETSSASSTSERTSKKKIIEIKEWSAVAFWSWNTVQDRCAICRSSIYDASIENQATGSTEINVAWGTCNHCFHVECVQRWLKNNTTCPLCGNEWDYQRIQRSG